LGILPEWQKLIYGGVGLNDDTQKLRNYKMAPMGMIYLLVKSPEFELFVAVFDTIHTFKVRMGFAIQEIKKLIHAELKIPVEHQMLLWNHHELQNDEFMWEYKIPVSATLTLINTELISAMV
jgi:hypothetical protein